MDIVHDYAAGIDISKRDAKVCVRAPGKRPGQYESTTTTWHATTNSILELREYLQRHHVTTVVMEATSDYWKPFYYLLEETLPMMLVNARMARNIPGKKTDVSDAAWLAQLAAHGLLRPSFVPPEPIRELRDLTRARAIVVRDRTRSIHRLEKFLESSGIKLSSVVSDLMGKSSRAMLDALVAGERDPEVLADLALGRLKEKRPMLVEALLGRFNEHHAFMTQSHLDQIDAYTTRIQVMTDRIDAAMAPFRHLRDALETIPGVSTLVADVIIAETGGDMSIFPTAEHLASWAGLCPGSNESAGRIKSSKILHGNSYLKAALGIAANAAGNSKHTYLAAQYRKLMSRRGRSKARVAVAHTILTAAWNMLSTGECYTDPGENFYATLNPNAAKNRALSQLKRLGYQVTLTQAAA